MLQKGPALSAAALLILAVLCTPARLTAQTPPNTALVNGKWFDGKSFKARTVYSVNGRFALRKPARVDETLDLAGTWVVPPFAEAHNHSIGTGVADWDKRAITRFLSDGVFYVQIQGNLPISAEKIRGLGLNSPGGLDAIFAQGSLTSSGGHPIGLIENVLLRNGYFPGFNKETLRDHRYFTVDTEAELNAKWPAVLSNRPDFIKVLLWHSDEHENRRDKPAFLNQRALDPQLLPSIVAKAHAAGLRVSAHVTTSADFHNAVVAGVDEIPHLPFLGKTPITAEDARFAARRGITVVTTAALVTRLPKAVLPDSEKAEVLKVQLENLRVLRGNRVRIAIGSDNVSDSSVQEVEYLKGLGIFDNLTLLKMWTETTAKTIFPNRKIGVLREGYEASFLALESNPVEDLKSVRRIKFRFKQGFLMNF